MREYTEENLRAALNAMADGLSLRNASSSYGIPRSTLISRVKGSQPRSLAFESYQKLSVTQEKQLTGWVCVQGALGLPPTHAQVRAIAASLLGLTDQPSALGKNWLADFLRRNPSIKVQRSKSIDAKRVNGASTDVIRTWFRHLYIPEIRAILPENRWNMDEMGFSSGQGDTRYVLGTAAKTKIRKKTRRATVLTSTIECISATGKSLPPLVIFKGKSVQQQ
jgi:hypothetical protein